MNKNRVVIIGIDGVPYRLMDELSESGVVHNFQKLSKEGTFKQIKSTIPEVSSVSWSSIITGENPGEHGIFGFTDLMEGTYTITYPNSTKLKKKTFWQKNSRKKHVILNVPQTYPAQELNGILVSGFVSPDFEKSIHPKEYVDVLKNMGYEIDVDSEKAHHSKKLFLDELFKVHEIRVKAIEYFWENIDWDVFMMVFTGSDRLGHFLWDAYEDEKHEHRKEFIEYFRKVDEAIGEITAKMCEGDSLIILSDHGMEKIKTNVNINTLLEQEGYLKLARDLKKGLNNIVNATKAFALDPARIYVNTEGRYPSGTVKENEKETVINELIELFTNLEWRGEKVIKEVYRGTDIYHGDCTQSGPDLVLVGNKGFSLRGKLFKDEIFEEDIFTGKHSPDDAFLLLKTKKQIIIPYDASVIDAGKIIQKLIEQ